MRAEGTFGFIENPASASAVSYATRILPRPLGDRSIRDVTPAEIASTIDQHERGLASTEDLALDLAILLGIGRLSRYAREYFTRLRGVARATGRTAEHHQKASDAARAAATSRGFHLAGAV